LAEIKLKLNQGIILKRSQNHVKALQIFEEILKKLEEMKKKGAENDQKKVRSLTTKARLKYFSCYQKCKCFNHNQI
jgi:hypothetical protein